MFYSTSQYSKVIVIMFKWMIALTMVQIAIVGTFGVVVAEGVFPTGAILIIVSTLLYLPLYIYSVGSNWPTANSIWTKFLAGAFGFARIGYERPGLNTLPWGIIISYGIIYAATLGLYQYAYMAHLATPMASSIGIIIGNAYMVAIPFIVTFIYGVGYLFGGKRQRLRA